MVSQNLKIAKNLNSTANELKELAARTKNRKVLAEIAKNPNTPIDLLIKLAGEYLTEIGSNPALELIWLENPNLIENIYHENNFTEYDELPPKQYLPDWLLKRSASHPDREIRIFIAKNWNNIGLELRELGKYEDAIDCFNEAIEMYYYYHEASNLVDGYYDAWLNKGDVFLENIKNYKEAIDCYFQAEIIETESDEPCYKMGLALHELGRYDEAIEYFDHAIWSKRSWNRGCPENAHYWNARSIPLGELGRYNEAIQSCLHALEISPNKPLYWFNIACYYGKQGKTEAAIEYLEKAILVQPEEYREMAKTDSYFDPIREDEEFQNLVYRS